MRPHTPDVSVLITGWHPSQAPGLPDMQGKAGHQTDPDVPVRRSSSPYASARVNTSIVLTRPGTGAIVEPTWRALCVRWKLVTNSQPSSAW